MVKVALAWLKSSADKVGKAIAQRLQRRIGVKNRLTQGGQTARAGQLWQTAHWLASDHGPSAASGDLCRALSNRVNTMSIYSFEFSSLLASHDHIFASANAPS